MPLTQSNKRLRKRPSAKVVTRKLSSGNTTFKIEVVSNGTREFHY